MKKLVDLIYKLINKVTEVRHQTVSTRYIMQIYIYYIRTILRMVSLVFGTEVTALLSYSIRRCIYVKMFDEIFNLSTIYPQTWTFAYTCREVRQGSDNICHTIQHSQ